MDDRSLMGLIGQLLDYLCPKRTIKRSLLLFDQQGNDITEAYNEINKLLNKEEYLEKKFYRTWREKWKNLISIIEVHQKYREKLHHPLDDQLDLLASAFTEQFLKERNDKYVVAEIARHRDYFDHLERYPLTLSQCKAIVTDEARNLIIAGAGTGKTSTLLGKAGYVLRRGFAKQDEVLLLSFGRDPRDEMLERSQRQLGLPLKASTFHSLGMSIVSEAQETKPNVSRLSTDQAQLLRFVEKVVDEKRKDPTFLKNLNDFLLSPATYKSQFEFKTQSEYVEYLRSQHLRSLKGDLVKSNQEQEIANFLYLNGVEYEYERPYEHSTASKFHGQYRPDFYLTDYNIYIEHFGVERDGTTAPFVDEIKYHKEMEWKRNLHREHGTKLVETYNYEDRDSGLAASLQAKLSNVEVEFKPIPQEKVFDRLNDLGLVTPLSGLIASFLNLYKSNNLTIEELLVKANSKENKKRNNAFVNVFSQFLTEYENELSSRNEIDFNDMINKATGYITTGTVKRSHRYVLVDEFQDISRSRYQLLKSILDQNSGCKLFAVGDDWQSIFRFAGSDLSLMTDFEKSFGESELMYIEENFRFNDKICDFSTRFILENPQQIRKTLKPKEVVTGQAVSLIYTRDPQREIEGILSQLSDRGGTVQIIGRYNSQKPKLPTTYDLQVEFLTAHRSKGTQADYVIIIGLGSGIIGFPCEITDDPVLQLVTPEPETYPHAEERRLFYVALTRARKHIYLLADPDRTSAFIQEIIRNGYEVDIVNPRRESYGTCSRCGGEIVAREGANGHFYSCSNYPYCEYKAPHCPDCEGYLVPSQNKLICDNCHRNFRVCPGCHEGALVERVGYSRFLGCTNYPDCSYKEK